MKQDCKMYVLRNIEVRSNLCFLDPSKMIICLSTMLGLFVVHNPAYIIRTMLYFPTELVIYVCTVKLCLKATEGSHSQNFQTVGT